MSNFIMLVGLPGCGKSTYAKSLIKDHPDYVHISSDAIRDENNLLRSETGQNVFETMSARTKQALKNGQTVIYDATNLSRKHRMHTLQEMKKLSDKRICILFTEPFEKCLLRNNSRNEHNIVPETRMKEMLQSFQIPIEAEGFDEIKNIQTEPGEKLENILEKTKGFEQDNPHHTLSLYEHIQKTEQCLDKTKMQNLSDKSKAILKTAALYHDIGKLVTKTYTNTKGELCDIAHFYGHENAGAYMMLSSTTEFDYETKLHIALLINWHMRGYLDIKPSKRKIEREMIGEEISYELEILENADRMAH